jgi:hydrogenase maturation protease
MASVRISRKILVLGIGNSLRCDDGIGVRIVEAMQARRPVPPGVEMRDGGTLGLSLLPEVEQADAVIVIDAAEIGAEPGTIRLFEGAAMDAQLDGKKRTAHEVALADLMAAARLMACLPAQRALLAVQPASTDWGLTPTHPVAAAIPCACALVASLLERWGHEC